MMRFLERLIFAAFVLAVLGCGEGVATAPAHPDDSQGQNDPHVPGDEGEPSEPGDEDELPGPGEEELPDPEGEDELPWELTLFCSEELEDPILLGWTLPIYRYGLFVHVPIDDPQDPQDMLVIGKEPMGLHLSVDEGHQVSFLWPGEIPFEIPEGTRVQLSSMGFTTVLTSPMGTLALHREHGFYQTGLMPFADLPPFSWETDCEFPTGQEVCGGTPPPAAFLSLRIGHGDADDVIVPAGGSATAGDWHFTNYLTFHESPFHNGECIAEGNFRSLISAYREGN